MAAGILFYIVRRMKKSIAVQDTSAAGIMALLCTRKFCRRCGDIFFLGGLA